MKRFSLALVISIITSVSGLGILAAQPAVDKDLALEEIILRATSDDNWVEYSNEFGLGGSFEEYQLVDGEAQFELYPSAMALYEKYGAEDVYYYVHLFDEMPLKDKPISTAIETRILVFPDETSAAGYLSEAYQAQVDSETAGEADDTQFAPIDPLPPFEHPAVGWTFLEG